eukprot:1157306-Pyramimonas_sp.AAC.1
MNSGPLGPTYLHIHRPWRSTRSILRAMVTWPIPETLNVFLSWGAPLLPPPPSAALPPPSAEAER